MMLLLTIWQGSSIVLAFLAPAKKQTFLNTPVYKLMVHSMSVGISTFLVLMAVFLGVRQSLTLYTLKHTPKKEKLVQLQARMAHEGPQQWLRQSKPSMPSTMALTLVWVAPFVPLEQALMLVWNLMIVVSFVTSLIIGQPSTSKNEASMVLGVMLMSTSVLVQGPFVTSS